MRRTSEPEAVGGVLVLDDGTEIEFDRILVATGRTARTQGLGLETLGVGADDDGTPVVDASLRTTLRVWAAGDVTGHPRFTHVAGLHGSLAASNALLGLRRRVDDTVPRVTFTQPELASVGVTTHAPGRGHRLIECPHVDVDRAVADADTHGTTRLVVDRRAASLARRWSDPARARRWGSSPSP